MTTTTVFLNPADQQVVTFRNTAERLHALLQQFPPERGYRIVTTVEDYNDKFRPWLMDFVKFLLAHGHKLEDFGINPMSIGAPNLLFTVQLLDVNGQVVANAHTLETLSEYKGLERTETNGINRLCARLGLNGKLLDQDDVENILNMGCHILQMPPSLVEAPEPVGAVQQATGMDQPQVGPADFIASPTAGSIAAAVEQPDTPARPGGECSVFAELKESPPTAPSSAVIPLQPGQCVGGGPVSEPPTPAPKGIDTRLFQQAMRKAQQLRLSGMSVQDPSTSDECIAILQTKLSAAQS